jgi:hypothetical protein
MKVIVFISLATGCVFAGDEEAGSATVDADSLGGMHRDLTDGIQTRIDESESPIAADLTASMGATVSPATSPSIAASCGPYRWVTGGNCGGGALPCSCQNGRDDTYRRAWGVCQADGLPRVEVAAYRCVDRYTTEAKFRCCP